MICSTRKLGRTETLVPPVLWRVGDVAPSKDVLSAALDAGLNWLVVPYATWIDVVVSLRESIGARMGEWSIVVGIDMESLRLRVVTPFDEKMSALGLKRCAAVLVENPSSAGVKSGWPFHRLGQLRDRGAVSHFFVECSEAQDAEWIVDNTPAHAVVVPYSKADQLPRYRLLKTAGEMGVAVVGSGTDDSHDVRLRAAEPSIVSQMVSLPGNLPTFQRIVRDLGSPFSESERDASWQAFCERVPEPAKPKGAHPPDFGT